LGGQKRSIWAADFETTTVVDDCRVWGWGYASVETAKDLDDVVMGQDIDSFIDWVSSFNNIVYFHNLNFDGSFIMDWLFNQGYTHTGGQALRGQFTTLISNMGSFYSMSVTWLNGKRTEFRDSAKKLPMSVSKVAQAFKLDEAKGKIDYHAERPVGHTLTAEEKEYLATDVLIMAKALRTQLRAGMTKLTVGADSLNEFKQILNPKVFARMFPILPMDMDAEIRSAYRGGFTYAAERFKGKRTGRGRVYDVNSLYPSVMYNELLPYAEPVFFEGVPKHDERYPLYIISITFTAKLKPGHIPCIQVKGSTMFSSTEYQSEIKDPVTMACTSVDLALWQDHYDLDILCYNGGWKFNATVGTFNKFIDKWMQVKANNEGGLRTLAKLQLNSLYGKFATNPDVTPKVPVFRDGVVKLVIGEPETREPIYTAMGAFITAYARNITVRAAQQHYDSFAYADTDSLHLLIDSDPDTLDVDPSKLGAWKFEYEFDSALFVRAKAYTERKPDHKRHTEETCPFVLDPLEELGHGEYCHHITHIAGVPEGVSKRLSFDSFVHGAHFPGKLTPQRVPGGIVLKDVGFTMNLW
jgi:hypothetical protein